MKVPYYRTRIIISGYKEKTIPEIATQINSTPKAVYAWLHSKNLRKRPQYTEMEIYMLQNFPVRIVADFIPHKTVNALRIKKSRLRKNTICTPVK